MSHLQRHFGACKKVRFPVSPCWSLPSLLSHSLPQHEAPHGQYDLLQEHSTRPAQFPHHDFLREQIHYVTTKSRVGESSEQTTPQNPTWDTLHSSSVNRDAIRNRRQRNCKTNWCQIEDGVRF